MSTGLALFLAFLFLAVNAFFVAAEYAVISSRLSQVEPLAERGRRGAVQALFALEHVSLMLAISQLGVTVASTSLGAIAEPAIAHLVEVPLRAVGLGEAGVQVVSFLFALLLVVFLHVVFGEMVPMNLSIAKSHDALLVLAPPLVAVGRVFGPVVRALDALAKWFVKIAGLQPKSEIASAYTLEEVATIVEESRLQGKLADDVGLLGGTLVFSGLTAADLMVPIGDLVNIEQPVTRSTVEALVTKTGFSRFPVVDESGNVGGYVHLKDVLHASGERRDEPVDNWRIRDLSVIPAEEEAGEALREMQASATHMVGVKAPNDGRLVGVLFLEDLLEKLIGQVSDSLQREEWER